MEQPQVTSTSVKAVIRIFSYEDQVLTGSITNAFLNRTLYFRDVVQMAAILESLYDSLSIPQSSVSYRCFREPKRRRNRQLHSMKAGGIVQEETEKKIGAGEEKASFLVHVQFRQNATWQGTITWVNKGETQHFRSVLEMIRLMTEAVESAGEGTEIRWVEE